MSDPMDMADNLLEFAQVVAGMRNSVMTQTGMTLEQANEIVVAHFQMIAASEQRKLYMARGTSLDHFMEFLKSVDDEGDKQ